MPNMNAHQRIYNDHNAHLRMSVYSWTPKDWYKKRYWCLGFITYAGLPWRLLCWPLRCVAICAGGIASIETTASLQIYGANMGFSGSESLFFQFQYFTMFVGTYYYYMIWSMYFKEKGAFCSKHPGDWMVHVASNFCCVSDQNWSIHNWTDGWKLQFRWSRWTLAFRWRRRFLQLRQKVLRLQAWQWLQMTGFLISKFPATYRCSFHLRSL